jgi:chorismate dehydratase
VHRRNLSSEIGILEKVSSISHSRLRLAAISFLNTAPLMWDFEHPPLNAALADRYQIDRMLPAECATRLDSGTADIGLVPIAALATSPSLRILPGCVLAAKKRVRSLLLVRRADQPLGTMHTVAADSASRSALIYARILFHQWGNPAIPFLPMAADLDTMLDRADAAILIGDPALLALEERANRFERTGEDLAYHDLADEWRSISGLPLVSAVWAASPHAPLDESVIQDFIQSRNHGLENMNALTAEWSRKLPISEQTIQTYLTTNMHYQLDDDCIEGIRGFFRMAAECGALPKYNFTLNE